MNSASPPSLLHLDPWLLVADKPAGLLAVPGRGEAAQDCLSARVQALHVDARVVHRLDMATSGLMLFARDAAVQRQLSQAFAERRVAKRYIAVVEGEVAGDAGEVDAPLAADWPNRPRQVVDLVAGRASLTRWRVLARGPGWTRLALDPVTGRTHQLRVHLLHIGHPIRGDALYAWPLVAAGRLMLHAESLSLIHPATGLPLALQSRPDF